VRPVRVAATEVSHWHSLHDSAYLRHLTGLPDVELVGVQDPDAGIAARRAAALGDPPAFTDHREMLDAVRPDFVIALGRHRHMARIAHDLLDRGLPFLMEKPMGVNATEVRGIADKAAARKAFVAVPLIQRYQPFTLWARELLAEGRFGPLSHIYMRLNRPTSARYPAWDATWMLDPEIAAGGCLRNLGSHGFDLFLHLTGEEADVTGAQLSSRALGQRVEDYASVLLRSAGGVLGTIEVGNTFPRDGTDGEWKIAGRDAMLVLKDGAMRFFTSTGEETMDGEPTEPLALMALRDALDHWRRGAPPPIDVHDCLRAVRLIDRAYELAGRYE
jgi:predicted dehydrogenase